MMWTESNKNNKESGAALALVIIMVVLLSIGMVAVSMMTQSAAEAMKTNSVAAERRTAIVNDALAKAVQDLNFRDGNPVRYGLDLNGRRCADAFVESKMGPYVSSDFPDEPVTVYCSQVAQSGKNAALASLILTGTNDCVGSKCQVGVDGGLDVKVSGGACDSSTPHMYFRASILNASGAWNGAGCKTLSMDDGQKLIQPAVSDASCPAANNYYAGNAKIGCSCPSDGGFSWLIKDKGTNYSQEACIEDISSISSAQLSPLSGVSTIGAFIDSQMAQIGAPGGSASYSVNKTNSSCAASMTPGNISQDLWNSIKSDIGSATCILQFTPGIYRLNNVIMDPNAATVVLAGTPDSSGTKCDPKSAGVQIQFAGKSQLNVAGGQLVTICGLTAGGSDPAIVAPRSGAWKSDPATNVIVTNGGSASATEQGLFVYGYVFAPGSPASTSINGTFKVQFNQGAMFKALSVSSTASPRLDSLVEPPPPFTGDRVVQFRFRGNSNRDLGTVQVVLKDYFGRRPSSGMFPITWNTLW